MSMIIVKIPRTKIEEMSEYANKMLHYGGRIMSCLEEMQNSEEMGERTRMGMGMRDYNYRYPVMGMREEEDYDMGMRGRMRDYRGRYI